MFDLIEVEEAVVLVVLGVVEQRHAAVLEVLVDGAPVTEVAAGMGVAADAAPVVAAVVALRRAHPGWGPRTIGHQLAQ